MKNFEMLKICSSQVYAQVKKPLESKKAYTLAETLIVLSILGIVAVITIPSAMKQTLNSAHKTKLKKALAVHQKLIEKSIVEENIQRDVNALNSWANEDGNCTNIRKYFKIIEDGQNSCQFKTADGVWWDVTSANKIFVTVNNTSDSLTSGKAFDFSDNKTFCIVTNFDKNGGIRISDYSYGTNSGDYLMFMASAKINSYLFGTNLDYIMCKNGEKKSCFYKKGTSDCNITDSSGKITANNGCQWTLYDDDGKETFSAAGCNANFSCNVVYADKITTLSGDYSYERIRNFCDNTSGDCSNPNKIQKFIYYKTPTGDSDFKAFLSNKGIDATIKGQWDGYNCSDKDCTGTVNQYNTTIDYKSGDYTYRISKDLTTGESNMAIIDKYNNMIVSYQHIKNGDYENCNKYIYDSNNPKILDICK